MAARNRDDVRPARDGDDALPRSGPEPASGQEGHERRDMDGGGSSNGASAQEPQPPRRGAVDLATPPNARRAGNGTPGGLSAIEALEEQLFAATEPYGLPKDPARLRYPKLWELMTVHHTSTGRTKQVCTLSIVACPTGFQAALRDMTYSCTLPVESESLEGILEALEAELSRPTPRWKLTRHGERANALKSSDGKKLAPWDSRK